MKLPALLIICSILSHLVHSQKNLREGFLVANNGDTLKGYINYREWYRNPVSVSFAPSKEVAIKHYTKEEINYFEILNSESYKRYTVNISMDSRMPGSIGDKDTSSRTEPVFLKILQYGKNVMLFSYTDALKQRFYIMQNDEPQPVELKNSVYMLNGQIMEEKQYRSYLSSLAAKYLSGDEKIANLIQTADYSAKTIMSICSKLNGLNSQEALLNNNGFYHSRFRFFAGAGLNQGTLKFSGGNHYAGRNSFPFYFPVIAAGVDILANPAIGRLFLRNQLAVTVFKTDGDAVIKYYESTEKYFLKFRQVNVSLHSQLSYNVYNQSSFKWFIGAGAGMNFSSYPVNQETLIKENLTGTTTTSVNDNYIAFIKRFWLNPSFRTGVTINKLDCSFLFFPGSSIAKYTGSDLTNSSLQLQVNFFFK